MNKKSCLLSAKEGGALTLLITPQAGSCLHLTVRKLRLREMSPLALGHRAWGSDQVSAKWDWTP